MLLIIKKLLTILKNISNMALVTHLQINTCYKSFTPLHPLLLPSPSLYTKQMMSYLFSLCVILFLTTIYFGIAVYKKDNSIIDRFYGITFVITAWFMVFLHMQKVLNFLFLALEFLLVNQLLHNQQL